MKKKESLPALIGEYDGVRFEVGVITPALAAELLTREGSEHHNRRKRWHRIKKYARTMKEGRWRLNFEWIGIDADGYVVEGQHRLEACVMSGVPFTSLVLWNLPATLFPYIGGALPRGTSDTIELSGGKNATTLAAAVAYVWRADNGLPMYMTGVGSRPDNDEALATLERHPGLIDSVGATRSCTRVFPSISMLTYLHYEFARRDPGAATRFVDKLASGADLREWDPVFLLRERLVANKGSTAKLPTKHVMALTIKAWNYTRAGRRAPKVLRWNETQGEAFPEIE